MTTLIYIVYCKSTIQFRTLLVFILLNLTFSSAVCQQDSIDYYLKLSDKLNEENDTFKFIAAASRYIEFDSTNWKMYLNRGVCLNKVPGQKMNAVKDYLKARQLNNKSYKPVLNLGSTFIDLGKDDLAMAYLDTALALNDSHGMIYYLIGVIYGKRHETDECLKYFSISEKLDPNNASLFKDRGIQLNYLKKYEDAAKEFDKSIKLDPKQWRTYCAKANALLHINKTKEAKETLDQAAKLSNDPTIDFFYAYYYIAINDNSSACMKLKEAVKKGMKDAEEFLNDTCK